MESTKFCSSSAPSFPILPFPSTSTKSDSRKMRSDWNRKRATGGMVSAATRRDHYNSHFQWNAGQSMVDESMIVLRKRIHEMKMIERNYEPPVEWMEWEKQCYASYDEFVCKFVGYLQSRLMNSRPSVALLMLFLVSVSIPVSTVTIGLRLMEVAHHLLSAVYHPS
ncbi:hypothetical protein K2173_001370 [Erythroxylum novogranatense]|uniref:Uncharacterized protein n=1 Tax=Erythroxylum novogranatense TaxID=1862640 RepID=A0AAV8T4L2_9ROSI|nr:hypothetical protein K2173_001370 [Erythroxylum novogranatense]